MPCCASRVIASGARSRCSEMRRPHCVCRPKIRFSPRRASGPDASACAAARAAHGPPAAGPTARARDRADATRLAGARRLVGLAGQRSDVTDLAGVRDLHPPAGRGELIVHQSGLAKLGARLIIQRVVEDEFDARLGNRTMKAGRTICPGCRTAFAGARRRPPRGVSGTKLFRTEPPEVMVIGAFVRGLSPRDAQPGWRAGRRSR
jgi:hypothetical protein